MKFLINLFNRRASAELTSDEFMEPPTSRRADLGEAIRNANANYDDERFSVKLDATTLESPECKCDTCDYALTAAHSALIDAGVDASKCILNGDRRGEAIHHEIAMKIRKRIVALEKMEGLG